MITNSFKDLYSQTEELRGRRLVKVLLVSIGIFLVVGIILGKVMDSTLKNDEETVTEPAVKKPAGSVVTLEGTISYVGPDYLPAYDITYTLTDSQGNDIVLLKSNDDKLEIVQGLYVKVTGRKSKTPDGKYEILQVNEVVINNGTN